MILDTTAVSALLAGDAGLAKLLGAADRHHLPVVVIGEFSYGLKQSSRRAADEERFRVLEKASDLLNVDPETAHRYADIREELRAAGTPIPVNDLWIAALARQHNLPVASRDAHFDRVRKLNRLSW